MSETCPNCGVALPRVPRQALPDGTPLCKACWRAHNGLDGVCRRFVPDPLDAARAEIARLNAAQGRWY
jgi:Zn-finger nucleic acid-binding protein